MIAVIDYDVGNISAVTNMLTRLGLPSKITSSANDLESAERLILPGNGSFDACMSGLRGSGLLPTIERRVLDDKVPLLGICVGAQMLGLGSEEGAESGLGWINHRVRRFQSSATLRVPHMGWTDVEAANDRGRTLLGPLEEPRFYFVHSYFIEPHDPGDTVLTAAYGSSFAAAVGRENILGVQFHPEKSHKFGKQLLRAWAQGA
jgi:glutamine amidotransferase